MAEKRPLVLDSFGGKQLIQSGDFIPIVHGGTGGTTAASARIALGLIIGTDVQPQSTQLTALDALSTFGSVVRTGTNTFATRTLVAPAAGITVSNGNGVSGNPTLALADDLAALEAVATTGYAVRTANNAWATRSFSSANNARLTVSNGDGIAGNTSIDLALVADTSGGSLLKFTRDGYGRVTGTSAVAESDLTALLNSVYLAQSGGSLTNYLTLHADPSAAMHAVTKQYVDNKIQGLDPKQTATVATTTALPTSTYSNGTAGVGATITVTAVGVLTVDSYATKLNDLVLVKDEAAQLRNGLYRVSTEGTAGVAAVLTRVVDMDKDDEFSGAFIPVGNVGTANKNSLWLANPVGATVTVGTTAIPFTQLNGATALTEGNGIDIIGNSVQVILSGRLAFTGQAVDLATTMGSGGTATKLTYDIYGRVTGAAQATAADVGAQASSTELSGLAALATTGFISRTNVGTYVARTLQAPSAGFTITNPDAVASNPTFALSNDLAGLEGLTGTGYAVRTAADTWAVRSLAVASVARLTVTNASGVAGNPTLDLAGGVVAPGSYDQVTVDEYGRVIAGSTGTAVEPTISALTNNESTTVAIANAVYVDSTGTFRKANANSASTSSPVGLAKAAIGAATVGAIATSGEVTATTGEWDLVTGQSGGLTPNAIYFLDNVTAGKLTSTVPGSGYLTQVGQAISATKMVVRIGERIQL